MDYWPLQEAALDPRLYVHELVKELRWDGST